MKKLKYFYKIENNKLIKGSGYKIPNGFIEYDIKNKPECFIEFDTEELRVKLSYVYKNKRLNELKSLIVEYKGHQYQADEKSQNRMLKKIQTLNDIEIVDWIILDNTKVKVTKQDLKYILKKADEKQSEIIIKYRDLINDLKTKALTELHKIYKDINEKN